jgi:pimeloyl-ACP methyl ester carboxylesterase
VSVSKGSDQAPASYVLLPGAGGDSLYWHPVAPRLRGLGHEVLTPDLPADDAAALPEYRLEEATG